METLSIPASAWFSGGAIPPPHARISPPYLLRKPPSRNSRRLSAFNAASRSVSELVGEDVMQMFLKDREENGDFISKVSDRLWLREVLESIDLNSNDGASSAVRLEEDNQERLVDSADEDDESGFLKLKPTQEWIVGESESAPMNRKALAKALRDDSQRRKKLNFLKYEALKRELMYLSIVIGTGCSGYCLLALSPQAAVSYGVGVLFSCLYLQLLYGYADGVSRDDVPNIFLKKKIKKIGIRSEDLEDFVKRTIRGSGMALSSPRLVIPAAIYALWILSHKYLQNDVFDFQIVPAMVGLFVYKAAALVQVYRDNQDLQLIFPDDL
ncbi:NF-kappa-B inhibitor-like protein [Hirschfeldia incana]|nr:NF-kappa-B inhibitor-like protein [Hirschfeldia incana]